jgi:hypothetical protein
MSPVAAEAKLSPLEHRPCCLRPRLAELQASREAAAPAASLLVRHRRWLVRAIALIFVNVCVRRQVLMNHGEGRTMTATQFAIRQAHGKNVDRYRRLLKTRLSDIERHYIVSRLLEEQAAMQAVDRLAGADRQDGNR